MKSVHIGRLGLLAIRASSTASNFLISVLILANTNFQLFGEFVFAKTLISLCSLGVTAGIPSMVLRSESEQVYEINYIKELLFFSSLSLLLVSIIIRIFVSDAVNLAIVFTIALINVVSVLACAYLRKSGRVILSDALDISSRPVIFLFFLALSTSTLSVNYLLLLELGSALVQLMIILGVASKAIELNRLRRTRAFAFKIFLKHYQNMFYLGTFRFATRNIDTFIVTALSTMDTLGRFKFLSYCYMTLLGLIDSVKSPEIIKQVTINDKELRYHEYEAFRRELTGYAPILFCVFVLMLFFNYQFSLLTVFANEWLPIFLIGFTFFVSMPYQLFDVYMLPQKKEREILRCRVFAFLVSLPLISVAASIDSVVLLVVFSVGVNVLTGFWLTQKCRRDFCARGGNNDF